MKLTNYIRDAFVKAVMNDVPSIDYDEQIRVAVQKAAFERLPKDVQKVWKNPATTDFLDTGIVRIGGYNGVSVAVPGFSQHGNIIGSSQPQTAMKEFIAQFNDLLALRNAQKEQRGVLEEKIRGVAASCTTRKALVELMPEAEKYLPKEETKASNLPAVANLVSDLVKAGWPKSEPKAKKPKRELAAA